MTCKFAIGLSFELVDFTNGASFLDQLESVLKRDKKPSRTTFNWKLILRVERTAIAKFSSQCQKHCA